MIAQAAVRRRLIKASGDISELGYDESTTTQELLEKAEAELFSVSDQSTKQDLVSLESILTDSFDRIEELSKNKGSLRGVRTGISRSGQYDRWLTKIRLDHSGGAFSHG